MSKRKSPANTPNSKIRAGAEASNFIMSDESMSESDEEELLLHLSDKSFVGDTNPARAAQFNEISDIIPIVSHPKSSSQKNKLSKFISQKQKSIFDMFSSKKKLHEEPVVIEPTFERPNIVSPVVSAAVASTSVTTSS